MDNTQNSNKPLLIVSAIVVIALIIGSIVYFASSMDNDDSDSSSSSSSSSEGVMEEEGVMVGGAAMLRSRDIIENAVNASNLSVLVTAVQAADLVDALKAEGPLTVFGPTDAAFEKLPAGTVETLVQPESLSQLQQILQFHVVAGNHPVSELEDGQRLTTLQGDELVIYKNGNEVTVNGARIETKDVFQKNGVAHIIDTVLIPPASETPVGGAAMLRDKNIVENVVNAPNLSTLVTAVQAGGLVETLSDENSTFTVFGPDNSAFGKLPAGTLTTLTQPANKDQLVDILNYHVVLGQYSAAQLFDGQKLKTVNGAELTVRKNDSTIQIIGGSSDNVATIVTPDVFQKNGVAHVIDSVLLPPAN
jgi:uncharacterized surface protein with fasciclin (FAS1) repeats